MRSRKRNDRGASSVEYSCLLAMLCMVVIPVLAYSGDGEEESCLGIGVCAQGTFKWVGRAIRDTMPLSNQLSSGGGAGGTSGPISPSGGSEGTLNVGSGEAP